VELYLHFPNTLSWRDAQSTGTALPLYYLPEQCGQDFKIPGVEKFCTPFYLSPFDIRMLTMG
jgi:hypothetical protein